MITPKKIDRKMSLIETSVLAIARGLGPQWECRGERASQQAKDYVKHREKTKWLRDIY